MGASWNYFLRMTQAICIPGKTALAFFGKKDYCLLNIAGGTPPGSDHGCL
jgi:hypothetical protein